MLSSVITTLFLQYFGSPPNIFDKSTPVPVNVTVISINRTINRHCRLLLLMLRIRWILSAVWDVHEAIHVDVKTLLKFLIIFVKTRFLTFFIFWKCLFSSGNFFTLLNLLSSYIKRLLSDGFNMAAIEDSPMKNHRHIALKRCHAHYKTLRQ